MYIPKIKKHIQMSQFYNKNYTMKQTQFQKMMNKVRIENQRLQSTVK